MNITVLPILDKDLQPEYIQQPFWIASVDIIKKNGRKVKASEKGASPEIAVRRLIKLLGL